MMKHCEDMILSVRLRVNRGDEQLPWLMLPSATMKYNDFLSKYKVKLAKRNILEKIGEICMIYWYDAVIKDASLICWKQNKLEKYNRSVA